MAAIYGANEHRCLTATPRGARDDREDDRARTDWRGRTRRAFCRGTARGPRATLDRLARALVARERHSSLACRRELGRDHRRADRLGRDVRRKPARRVRDPRLRHAEGDRPDRVRVHVRAGRCPQRRVRRARGSSGSTRPSGRPPSSEAVTRLRSPEFAPSDGDAGIESVGNPFSETTFSENGRIAYAEAQFDQTIEESRSRLGRRRAGRRTRICREGRRDGRVQRRRRVPAGRAGNIRDPRAARRDHRAVARLPHLRGDDHPDRARDRRGL